MLLSIDTWTFRFTSWLCNHILLCVLPYLTSASPTRLQTREPEAHLFCSLPFIFPVCQRHLRNHLPNELRE